MVTIMAVFNYKIERKIKVSCNTNVFFGFSCITLSKAFSIQYTMMAKRDFILLLVLAAPGQALPLRQHLFTERSPEAVEGTEL